MKRMIAVSLLASSMMCITTAVAHAEDIGGLILVTRVIFEDSQLVDHVICAETARPCIDFGAPHITLRLNGFTITGPAQPDAPADALSCPTVRPALANYKKAVEGGLLKIMSKLGLSTISSYRGAQIFEAIGLDRELVERHVTGTDCHVSGVTLTELASDVLRFLAEAYGQEQKLLERGIYRYR